MPSLREVLSCAEVLTVGALMGVACVAQWVTGDFPVEAFRFPINLIIISLWLAALGWLYARRDRSRVAQALLSTRSTVLSIVALVAVGVVLGVQREPDTMAWPTIAALLFVLSHLTLVILRGWRNEAGVRWRFVLNHLGVWLVVAAGFWGAPDRELLRAVLPREVAVREVFDEQGRTQLLDYKLRLVYFDIDYFADGAPSMFEARVEVDGAEVRLRPNHPARRAWNEMIYLANYDESNPSEPRYCVVEVVRNGWRWVTVVGIAMLVAGAVLMFAQGPRNGRGAGARKEVQR